MIIIDLDDTIFQTKSMNPQIFDPAISIVKRYYETQAEERKVDEIISALWSKPVDVVFTNFKTPQTVVSDFYHQIANIDYNQLDIQPYDDYKIISSLPGKKILVTTGLQELQKAKIKALGIEKDFDSVHIDDPRKRPRQHKIDIFKQILLETKKAPSDIWVIGDNPESELKAGKQLGMRTIQRKSSTKLSSVYADFEIESFEELKNILA